MKTATAAFAVVLAMTLGTTACTKQEVAAQTSVGPSLVVEQFMRAANARDLQSMGRLFGTKDGPIIKRDDKGEVERRMFAIATELQHSDFEVAAEEMVPGRSGEATRLIVRLTKEDVKFNVPFTLVRYKDTWLVEQIALEVLTAPR